MGSIRMPAVHEYQKTQDAASPFRSAVIADSPQALPAYGYAQAAQALKQ